VAKTMLKTEETYSSAMELAQKFEDNFVELASTLSKLKALDPKAFAEFRKLSGVGNRKAYYLVKIADVFHPLKVPKITMKALGWTKCMMLSDHINSNNKDKLVKFALDHTVKEIEAFVKGGDVANNAHSVLMYFNEQDYSELTDALVAHGAKRSGRGLVNKEEALISLLKSLKEKTKK